MIVNQVFLCSINGTTKNNNVCLCHGLPNILSPLLRHPTQEKKKKKIPLKIVLLFDNAPGQVL